jgi:hypothetical protein
MDHSEKLGDKKGIIPKSWGIKKDQTILFNQSYMPYPSYKSFYYIKPDLPGVR